MSDQPMTDCPSCGKAALSKLVSAAGFQLKGSGWYATDFRDNKKGKSDSQPTKEGSPESAATSSDSGASGSNKETTSKESSGTASDSGKASGGSGK